MLKGVEVPIDEEDAVLLVELLVALAEIVGLVTVLDSVDGQPDPRQIETHRAPLQDVVTDDVAEVKGANVDDGGNVLRLVPDGHPRPTHRIPQRTPLQEVV